MLEVDPAFGHWLAGLTDGEGCFWIHRERGGFHYSPQFKIKLRADDRPMLVECQRVLKVGNLYNHPASKSGGRNSRPSCSWMVQSRVDTERLAEFFDAYRLRSKKARDYVIWREAIDLRRNMKRGNRWHGPMDWTPMLEIKARLEAVRQYPEAACA